MDSIPPRPDRQQASYVRGRQQLDEDGRAVAANGVREEFDIAISQSKYVLPVGATGSVSAELWREVNADFATPFLSGTPKRHSINLAQIPRTRSCLMPSSPSLGTSQPNDVVPTLKENNHGPQDLLQLSHVPDNWRASQVRNMGILEGNPPASDNAWEQVTKGGDGHRTMDRWPDGGRTAAVVLIGSGTKGRKWIKHEIRKAWATAGRACVHPPPEGPERAAIQERRQPVR